MGENFCLNSNITIILDFSNPVIEYWIEIFKRDIKKVLVKSEEPGSWIYLIREQMDAEQYCIFFSDSKQMVIEAGDELGFIYALLFLSEHYLGVMPFWFWNEQAFEMKKEILVELKEYKSSRAKVHFRGWFINDEVLIDKWSIQNDSRLPWEMVFEALVRCGGNMVIPGTDKNSKLYRKLASGMGLWITHHHAEPLGAEMFARAYPELNPSYAEHKELFYQLWEEGIREQEGMNIIWNLGFRGQGDCPFWETDPQYETQESRGGLISSIIRMQYDLVHRMVERPVCSTNLYGETMELYRDGYLDLPEDVIKIWADNGYGKMVSRRQGNNNPRVYALPGLVDGERDENRHGIYYHVSFYDLQAANHLTMLPNPVEFVASELEFAFSQGADEFLIVNASNIKPHVYYLDAIRKLWGEDLEGVKDHGEKYVESYYFGGSVRLDQQKLLSEIVSCYEEYSNCTVKLGPDEDEHAGEQFYNYTTRILTWHWLKGSYLTAAEELKWATNGKNLASQMKWYQELCERGREEFIRLAQKCESVYLNLGCSAKTLFEDSIFLQVKIHLYCLEGAVFFCNSFQTFINKEYALAFYLVGQSREKYQEADDCMRNTEHGIWKGFYQNDCLCDIKQTAYLLKSLMGYIRNIGEGPHFYSWQREYLYKEEDKRVFLLTNMENHLTDEEIYQCMMNKILKS